MKVPGVHHTIAIPSNFPLPVYPNNVLTTSFCNRTSGQPMASVMIVTKDSPKTVFDWYQLQCATAWKVSTPPSKLQNAREKSGDLYILDAVKGEHQVSISCAKKKSGNTVIAIYWILKKHA